MMTFFKKFFGLTAGLLCMGLAKADEGMWLPQLLESLNEKRMQQLGMKISAKDIYDINKGSLKDAIVSFGGFCTGEVVSEKGLVLTNHHCGFESVQKHSTLDKNYIRDGFWARNGAEELPNAGLYVTFIVRIDDVSDQVLKGVSRQMKEPERQSIVDRNISALKKATKLGNSENVLISPFFEGNKYYLFVTETYTDVRLVGAPPSSIGNFGQDSDNWMWPRHTGDFSVFRIYAGKNNQPAEYSPDNVPYVPKKALTISLKGMQQDDFTMVFGFPGRTTEYLPSEAVRQIMEVNDPAKILVRDRTLSVMNRYMRANEELKIKYASKYAGIANAWKKWQGEILGLKRTDGLQKKLQYEAAFQKRLDASDLLKARYGLTLRDLNNAYKAIEPYALTRDYYLEITSKIELFSIIKKLRTLKAATGKPGYEKELAKQLESLTELYKNLSIDVDKDIFSALLPLYMEQQASYIAPVSRQQFEQYGNDYQRWAGALYAGNFFLDASKVLKGATSDPSEIFRYFETDPAAKLIIGMTDLYDMEIAPRLNELQARINGLQRDYMKAQTEVFTDRSFYPDANSTLRVGFGKVDDYKPADGIAYNYYTYLDGVMEKYKPGDYEFDVPEKLRQLYQKKEYGRYGVKNPAGGYRMPVCFIASNHTTGGNSGSPVLDANGQLVGINFDRVWEGTMSDISYDASICRNIMVDIRYVLFLIEKYAGAGHLIREMKLAHAIPGSRK
ncbi:S46 family peptidase [Niabella sp. CC-SYL272]|uniref:S46 family peptidase n=1 Tax=Niabella agricola TaxID=2891571 RepID=UPI001F369C73|nr:S46 family peptidase [Niabella agricola]MCF3110601.1 S46 family peptidase [Niabella agricola]